MANNKLLTVALVGSPNVGKSTLFNRLIRERLAIVENTPGVTRDRIYGKVNWLRRQFALIDTGGLVIKEDDLQKQIRLQVKVALKEADIIIFVTNTQIGITKNDEAIAKLLFRTNKKVIVAANKVDNSSIKDRVSEFYSLGFGDVIPISATHSIGVSLLLDLIVKESDPEQRFIEENTISFSVIGQPNVGKSSLVNALLRQERSIVSPEHGTTRDAIDSEFKREKQNYLIIDTAGIRKKGKLIEKIEKYSVLRAFKAIDRSDIVLLVLEANRDISEQDLKVGGYAFAAEKPVIIVVNKWDLVKKDTNTMDEMRKKIYKKFKYLSFSPILFTSALKKQKLNFIFEKLLIVNHNLHVKLSTNVLNSVIGDAQMLNQAPDFNGGRLKIYYSSQVNGRVPTFILFCNSPKYVHFSYKRYLENQLREHFGFEGVYLKLIFRESK